jgi:chromodomain-helicase-DNA-binding protein 4
VFRVRAGEVVCCDYCNLVFHQACCGLTTVPDDWKCPECVKAESVGDDGATDEHNDACQECGGIGELLCCDTCNLVYHARCLDPPLAEIPSGVVWGGVVWCGVV